MSYVTDENMAALRIRKDLELMLQVFLMWFQFIFYPLSCFFFSLTQTPDVFSTVCVWPVKVKGFISSPWYNFSMKIIVLCFKSLWYWRHVKTSDGEALMLTKILLWSHALYKLGTSWARTRKCLYFTYSSQCCVSCWMLSFYSQTLLSFLHSLVF